MDEDEIDAIRPDFIILDEFHRCGAEQWGQDNPVLRDRAEELLKTLRRSQEDAGGLDVVFARHMPDDRACSKLACEARP